jgi:hypothetical protein
MVGSRDVAPVDTLAIDPSATGMGGVRSRIEAARASLTGTAPGPGRGLWGTVSRVVGRARDKPLPAEAKPMERMKALISEYNQSMRQKHGWNPFAYGATMNQTMDNTARLTYGLWRLAEGDTVAEAARGAAKYIGDYTELGAATGQLAAVFPFFRWSRFNVPLQVEGLLRQPHVGSKLAIFTGDDAENERMRAEGASLPEWVLDRHHVLMGRTPEGKVQILRGVGLPIEDLNKIFARTGRNTMSNIISEVTPILKVFIEYGANYSFFTGEPIDDKDDMYAFYKRGYAWATMPGISPTLGEYLAITQQVNPDTGQITYRSDNPMGMYVFSSFFGRFAQTADGWWDLVENRNGEQWYNLLTGVKVSTVWPERPPLTTFNEALGESPYLRNLWDEYQRIPLFPQFNDAAMSERAKRALTEINAFRRIMRDTSGRDVSWDEAADRWGEVGEENIEGEQLARRVKDSRWKQEGKKARDAFIKKHHGLRIAIETSLSDHERIIALGLDATPGR